MKAQKDFVAFLSQVVDWSAKYDTPMMTKLPLEVDVLELMMKKGMTDRTLQLTQAIVNLAWIVFSVLLHLVSTWS